jgi:hypothetical protein
MRGRVALAREQRGARQRERRARRLARREQRVVIALDQARVEIGHRERLARDDPLQKRRVGVQPDHFARAQRAQHPAERFRAIRAVHDQLAIIGS